MAKAQMFSSFMQPHVEVCTVKTTMLVTMSQFSMLKTWMLETMLPFSTLTTMLLETMLQLLWVQTPKSDILIDMMKVVKLCHHDDVGPNKRAECVVAA